jgi:hypothetical protein
MKWLRIYGWPIALVLVVVYFVWLRPGPKPNARETIAGFEAQRAQVEKDRAERDARRAEFDAKIAKLQTDHTLFLLRMVGEAYRAYLSHEKKPPQAADFAAEAGDWKSPRDEKPFVIVWGVDLNKLPDGGAGMALAWEQTGGPDGSRCVLMADGKTAKVVTAAEFEKLPKVKAGGG